MEKYMKYIGQTWRCANIFRERKYKKYDIGAYQDSYIINICKHPGLTQEQISKLIYVHKSNVARQLSVLEEKGYIYKVCDENDKRNLLVYPTKKAKDSLEEIFSVHQQWNELMLTCLSDDEKQMFLKLIKKIHKRAKEIVEN